MTEEARWNLILELDEELLLGGVVLSEWCSFIVREADIAFANGAFLASILTATAGIETYLRSEYSSGGRVTFHDLIERSPIDRDLAADLHRLRLYRNRWVHVDNPWNDLHLLEQPEVVVTELEEMALFTARTLRRTIYENQCV